MPAGPHLGDLDWYRRVGGEAPREFLELPRSLPMPATTEPLRHALSVGTHLAALRRPHRAPEWLPAHPGTGRHGQPLAELVRPVSQVDELAHPKALALRCARLTHGRLQQLSSDHR